MRLLVIYSDGTEQNINAVDDAEILAFVVGGTPKATQYNNDFVAVYSDEASKSKPNRIDTKKQLFGAVAIMRREEYENVIYR